MSDNAAQSMNLPLYAASDALYSAAQVRTMDNLAINQYGCGDGVLMERAGKAVFDELAETFSEYHAWQVVCGAGNNAGDGYVIARLAKEADYDVQVIALVNPEKLTGDAVQAYERFQKAGGEVQTQYVYRPDAIIIDCILGTGLDRNVEGAFAEVVQAINASGNPVVAVDIPSGLHADSGRVMGVAVQAVMTVSFIGLKQGLLTGEAPDYTGEIVFNDLQVPGELYSQVPFHVSKLSDAIIDVLPVRQPATHKGQCGHALLIGGNQGYSGAILMSGEAALRAGAGLVSMATHTVSVQPLVSRCPELMSRAVASADDLEPLLSKANVIGIGPGLGTDAWAQGLFAKVLECRQPLVLDADALNLLACEPMKRDDWVLTPHPGEAARMLDATVADVQQNRFDAVRELQSRFGGVVLLKGAGTLISNGTHIWVNPMANPVMASAGMGDVLTGMITSFIAQGVATEKAACAAAYLHAVIADVAADGATCGVIATDLFAHFAEVLG